MSLHEETITIGEIAIAETIEITETETMDEMVAEGEDQEVVKASFRSQGQEE